jgi:protein-disulfide isomerase/uncharacterized membrane protein
MAEGVKVRKGGTSRPVRTFPISSSAYWKIAALLAAAVVLSAFLISKHFGGGLPGCGPQSDCEALERTPWGTVPGISWPVSFVGLAYFFALLIGWMVADRKVPAAGRWLLRAGGVASLLFIGAMLVYRKFCPYCIGAHAANLAMVALVERETWRTSRRPRPGGGVSSWGAMGRIAGSTLGAFLIVSMALGLADARFRQKARTSAEADRRESTERILAQTQAQASSPPTSALAPLSGTPADMWGSAGFTGRYRLGPKTSPIRIVMLTDYQCIDCRKIEREVGEILASRNDVAVSIKHFPMCMEAAPGIPCNRFAKQTLHPNACRAARAAEAAGILKGDPGFWEMHRWLFSVGGDFTDAQLEAGLRRLGYDPASFLPVMRGEETLRRVRSDCEEGGALGLYYTPMIFVNGIEFKGWNTPGALRRTVEEVAGKNPPPMDASADRPVLADTKDIQDWIDQPVRAMPPDSRTWSVGAKDAGVVSAGSRFVDVILFGDYQEPWTAAMDLAIRDLVKSRSNIRYTFRHFPIDPKANPTLPAQVRPEAIHPLAGRAAQAAEAAGRLGGAQGYWRMHDWLMRNLQSFSDETLRAESRKMGMDAGALFAEMGKPEIAAAIVEDARAAQQLGLTAVPMVFVNGKWVWRTTREGENVALRVIEAAGRP